MRLVGQLSAAIPVQLGSYRREFEYWSGRPVWRNVHDRRGKRHSHPDGYQRMYDAAQRMYHRVDLDGTPVTDVNGHGVWDTVAVH